MDSERSAHEENSEAALHKAQEALINHLKSNKLLLQPCVEAAFRAIPRHLFLPGVEIQKVYSDIPIETKSENGAVVSASSQPAIMAIMLQLLQLQPGQHILEIGAGTGYNAALMAHIVGETGRVTTIDIDEDIVLTAREHLQAAGLEHRVQVVLGDGGIGYADNGPYDCIILTVSSNDITAAWQEQLKPGGRLLLPFKLTALRQDFTQQNWRLMDQILLTLIRRENYLESVDMRLCSFVHLRGMFAVKTGFIAPLGPDPALQLGMIGPGNTNAIYTALSRFRQDDTTDIKVTSRELWALRLWLALRDTRYCEIYGRVEVTGLGTLPPLKRELDPPITSLGLTENLTTCLLMRTCDDERFGLTIRSFGSDRALAGRLMEHILTWDAYGRPLQSTVHGKLEGLRLCAYPADTPYTTRPPEFIVDRQDVRIIFQCTEPLLADKYE